MRRVLAIARHAVRSALRSRAVLWLAVAVLIAVILLPATVEGDGTALYLADELKMRGVSVTRLARGLPAGGQLEYVSKAVLADAIAGRQKMD